MAAELLAALDGALDMPRDILNIIASYGEIKINRVVLYDERKNSWSIPGCEIDKQEYLTYQMGACYPYYKPVALDYAVLNNVVVQFTYEDRMLYITDLNNTVIKAYPTEPIYGLFVIGNKIFTEYTNEIQISTLDGMQIIPSVSKKTIERLKYVNENIIITTQGQFINIYDHKLKLICRHFYESYGGISFYMPHPERSDAVSIYQGDMVYALDINHGVLTSQHATVYLNP